MAGATRYLEAQMLLEVVWTQWAKKATAGGGHATVLCRRCSRQRDGNIVWPPSAVIFGETMAGATHYLEAHGLLEVVWTQCLPILMPHDSTGDTAERSRRTDKIVCD